MEEALQIKAGKEFQRLETLLQKLNLTISERGLGIYNCRECLRRVILVFSTEGGNKLLSLSLDPCKILYKKTKSYSNSVDIQECVVVEWLDALYMFYYLSPSNFLLNIFVHVLVLKCSYLSGETIWVSYIRGWVLQKLYKVYIEVSDL